MESPLVKFLNRPQLFCKSALDVVCVDGVRGAIYILDRDIALFAIDNNERLSSCVSRSVVYSGGEFYTMEYASSGYDLQPAPDLSTERLFAPFLQPAPQFAANEPVPQTNLGVGLIH